MTSANPNADRSDATTRSAASTISHPPAVARPSTATMIGLVRSAFGLAEVKRNLVAGAGGLFRLPRAIGQAAAMEAILTGEPIPAARAYDLGLVSRLTAPGEAMAEARRLADQITAAAPMAVWESRKVVRAAAYENDETLIAMTNAAMGTVMASEDLQEGLTAFIEKRAPEWKGR